MEIAFVPEPTPREREALVEALQALESASSAPPAYLSAWRSAALEPDADGDPYEATAPRRKSPGAARA